MTLRAEMALEKKDYVEGLRLLTELEKEDPRQSGLHLRLARTHLGLGRFKDSQREFETVLDGDPENASACQGLALVRLGHRAAALDAFRAAIAYAPGLVPARRALIRLLEEDAAHAPETPTDVKLRKVIHSERSATGKALAPADELDQQRNALRAIAAHRARSAARVREIRARAGERAAARAALQKNKPPTCAADISKPAGEASARDAAASGAKLSPPGEFLIVSGLPRSGTSLMMQILDAGGVPLMTDGIRRADTDNTEGYFEWEAVRTLPKDPNILEGARGKGFKVVSLLLSALPRRHRYKILFMQRPASEVAASQHTMLQRRFPAKTHAAPAKMAESLDMHRKEVLSLMRGISGICLLEVSYPDLVREPAAWLPRIRDFLAPEWALDISKAASVIKPGLHRQKLEGLAKV